MNKSNSEGFYALSPEHRQHGLLDNPWSEFFDGELPHLAENNVLSIISEMSTFQVPGQIRSTFTTVIIIHQVHF